MSYQELVNIFPSNCVVTSMSFDPYEELLWTLNELGYVSSYYSASLGKYTSFRSHLGDACQVCVVDGGVVSIGATSLRMHSRLGLPLFTVRHDSLKQLQCIAGSQDGTIMWASGHQDQLVTVDMTTASVCEQVDTSGDHTILRSNHDRFLCAGTSSGKIELFDQATLKVQHTLEAHTGGLTDFDVSGNSLVTCGCSARSNLSRVIVDRYLMVYDLRMVRALPPCRVSLEPVVVRFQPAFSSSVLVLDQNGLFQIVNPNGLSTPASMEMHQINLTPEAVCFTAAVSSTSHCLAFADTTGSLHLFGHNAGTTAFNNYSRPSVFAEEEPNLPTIDFDNFRIPFSAIPLRLSEEPLLSAIHEQHSEYIYRRPPVVERVLLESMKVVDFVGTAPNPRNRLRNQVPYDTAVSVNQPNLKGTAKSPMNRGEDEFSKQIPKMYRRVELRYSRLGLANFDFKHYNKTNFAGLEIHIPNAYCNAMLQVLYFLEPLKAAMQNHSCEKEACLACEFGFLCDMLDQSTGDTCQASNFLRAFRALREASALGLLVTDDSSNDLSVLIQRWNRFVLQQLLLATDPKLLQDISPLAKSTFGALPSIIKRLFNTQLMTATTCRECNTVEKRESNALHWSLTYPRPRLDVDSKKLIQPKPKTFSQLLSGSLLREQQMQAWCDHCKKYQSTKQQRSIQHMPDVLSINCQVDGDNEKLFWKHQQEFFQIVKNSKGEAGWHPWLPYSICVRETDSMVEIEDASLMDGPQNGQQLKDTVYYDLVASVVHIQDRKTQGNLAVHIRVSANFHAKKNPDKAEPRTQWYLFNDFAITPIEKELAVDFTPDWKVPCIVIYARRNLNKIYDLSVHQRVDPAVLLPTVSQQNPNLQPLQPGELPRKGHLVGLDAEFVTINQEETELASDGTKTTIKPSNFSLARLTAVRGSGTLEGVPFIDDYIATSEQVVDYLTKFSGIKPGDLDANVSSKHLVTLKQAYRKLRFLIDRGVSFVGHGLKKDFRVINILVPKDQILDTVELFHLPNQRYVSLRFLAWFFLRLRIQSVTHDSTEDARTALRLYRRYQQLEAQNELTNAIRQLYEAGRKNNWQVPT